MRWTIHYFCALMKYLYISLLAGCIVITTLSYINAEKQKRIALNHTKEPSCYYDEQTGLFDKYKGKYKIVMLGTSLTARCHWNELLNSCDIANRGIGGDVTANMVKRIGQVIGLSPDTVYIEAGINDLRNGISIEVITGNISSIIDSLKRHYVTPVLFTVPYVTKSYQDKHLNKDIKRLNEAIKLMPVYVMDLNKILSENDYRPEKYTVYDGLHLSGEAYEAWGGLIK